MKINVQPVSAAGIKVTLQKEDALIGKGYLYLLSNDLHQQPFGLIEDVSVEEIYRGQGYGKEIINTIIAEAKKRNCYKLICTSRFSNQKAHQLYGKMGFKTHGTEFRIDF